MALADACARFCMPSSCPGCPHHHHPCRLRPRPKPRPRRSSRPSCSAMRSTKRLARVTLHAALSRGHARASVLGRGPRGALLLRSEVTDWLLAAHCPLIASPPLHLSALQIKEAEAEKERQQDISYMQQQTAQLDKQERERQMLLEKVKAVQARLGGRLGGQGKVPPHCHVGRAGLQSASKCLQQCREVAFSPARDDCPSSPSPWLPPPLPPCRTARQRMPRNGRLSSAGWQRRSLRNSSSKCAGLRSD